MIFVWVALGVLMGLSGDFCFKTSSFPSMKLLYGFLLYAGSGVPVWIVYRRSSWMSVALLWSVLALVVSVGIGVLMFREHIAVKDWIAFGLALAAIVLWNSEGIGTWGLSTMAWVGLGIAGIALVWAVAS